MSFVVLIAACIAFDTTACDTDVISPTPSSAPVTVPRMTSMRLPPTSPTACSAPVIAVATALDASFAMSPEPRSVSVTVWRTVFTVPVTTSPVSFTSPETASLMRLPMSLDAIADLLVVALRQARAAAASASPPAVCTHPRRRRGFRDELLDHRAELGRIPASFFLLRGSTAPVVRDAEASAGRLEDVVR